MDGNRIRPPAKGSMLKGREVVANSEAKPAVIDEKTLGTVLLQQYKWTPAQVRDLLRVVEKAEKAVRSPAEPKKARVSPQ